MKSSILRHAPRCQLRVRIGALALLVLGAAAWAQTKPVHRCEVGGRVTFQQTACSPGQRASEVLVPGPETNVASAPARRAATAASAPASAAPALQPTLPAAASVPPEHEACLAYLKPLLHDPASGRILSSERDGRVWRVKLQAADGRGRLHTREAACEFINGRVDDGWSRIQLKRLGWFAPRILIQGSGPEARRAARALEESIEARP